MRQHARIVLSIITLALATHWGLSQTPLGSTFRYQGILSDASGPISGTVDLQFDLYAMNAGGTALDSETYLAMTVTDGLVSVDLDYGANALDGDERWLEILVDGTALTPRQRLAPAPYALQTRGIFVDDNEKISIGGLGFPAKVNITGDNETAANLIHTSAAPGPFTPVATISAGNTGPAQAGDASSLAWRLKAGNGGWTMVGGIDLEWNDPSLGVTTADMVFRTRDGVSNPGERMRLTYDGRLGIGTDMPDSLLSVAGNVDLTGNLVIPYTGIDPTIARLDVTGNAAALGPFSLDSSAIIGRNTGSDPDNTVRGVHGIVDGSGNLYGVFGEATGSGYPVGVRGESNNVGVYGKTNNGTFQSIALRGYAEGNPAYGLYAEGFDVNQGGGSWGGYLRGRGNGGEDGYGLQAKVDAFSNSTIYGVHSEADGQFTTGDVYGVFADAIMGSGVNGYGVYSQCETGASGGGYGVYASTVTQGSAYGYGLRGHVSKSGTGWGYGTYSQVTNNEGDGHAIAVYGYCVGTGYAGYFLGPKSYFSNNVGIGTTSPVYQLELSLNSAAKPTSSSWTITSDRRLKENIKPIVGALDTVLKLRGVTYNWIDPESQGGMDGTYHGLIAQDVEEVLPNWVEEGPDGYKRLTIIGFEALAVEALRDLRAEKDREISRLETRVRKQQDQIEALMRRLDRLEARESDR